MAINLNDVKPALRKREFPFSARDALSKAEELLSSNGNIVQMMKQTELAMEIIAEFVFSEVDRKGFRKKLTCIQELELMQVISDHMMFDGGGNEASRNAVFLLLFPAALPDRVRLLVMLVSLAASTKNIPVLNAAGLLIQQVGYSSSYSGLLVKGLVNDHFLLVHKSSPSVLDLPNIAPLFSSNFLTAATEVYTFSEIKGCFVGPPEDLLEIISNWVSSNPNLCVSPLLSKAQPALPQGGIPMIPITPYAGLIKWCVYSRLNSESAAAGLYLKLESSLLGSLVQVNGKGVVGTQDLINMVVILHKARPEGLPLAVNALAEALQVIVSSNSLYGQKQELWLQLSRLPSNKLLKSIIKEQNGTH